MLRLGLERWNDQPRTPYLTGNEAADNLSSALADLKTAILQYQEAGGKVKLTKFWNDEKSSIIVLDVGLAEMKGD